MQTNRIHFRSTLLVSFYTALFLSQTVHASFCERLFVRLFPHSVTATAYDLKTEAPEIAAIYPSAVLEKAITAYKTFNKSYDRDASLSLLQKIQPFLDIEEALHNRKTNFNPAVLGGQIGQWKSRNEILPYFYKRLAEFKGDAHALVDWLRENDGYFNNAYWLSSEKASAITFSFEKETHGSRVTRWYRPGSISEDAWLKLSDKERLELIKNDKKWGEPSVVFIPTKHRPAFLGAGQRERFMADMNGELRHSSPPIEVKHFSFTLDLDQMFQQMGEVSRYLGETGDFHVHVVFPFPKHSKESFRALSAYWEHLNEYLYFKGIEEGLHPARLTSLPKDGIIPTNWSDVEGARFKYYGVGFRTGIYGSSPVPGHELVGMELRDSTRNLKDFKELARTVAKNIEAKAWEKYMTEAPTGLLSKRRTASLRLIERLNQDGFRGENVIRFLKAEENLAVPFIDFAGGLEAAQFREDYYQDLLHTFREYEGYQKTEEKIDEDLLRSVLRYSITQWAKKAKPSSDPSFTPFR